MELVNLTSSLFDIVIRLMRSTDRDFVYSHLSKCSEISNFLCSAIMQIDPSMSISFRSKLENILKIWNDEFQNSKNSIEPDGNVSLLDTARVASILLGSSINSQLATKNKKSAENTYNSLSTINDYSDKINLSDLAVKMLQEDLSGLR